MVPYLGNAQGRASVRSDTAFLGLCGPPRLLPPLYVSHISLSQKYVPTCSPIARFTASCGRRSAPFRICRRSHLPTRTPPDNVRFSLLPVARPPMPLAPCSYSPTHPRRESTGPDLPSHKCFRGGCCKSRSGCLCCKCFLCMLQAFVQNVSSVSHVCCKRFWFGCCTCFIYIFQEYVQNVLVVSVLCCNKCVFMLHFANI
jgi:hypothetical protein